MKISRLFSIAAVALGLLASACASPVEPLGHGKQAGAIRCGGNHFVRLAGSELHFVNYIFRNRGEQGTITVERMRFWDATGLLIFDSMTAGFPGFSNRVLGPGNQTLEPNQTGQLDVTSFLPHLTDAQRPMQAEFDWSASREAKPLSVDLIRLVQALDPTTQARGAEKTRDSQDCDELGKVWRP